MMNSQAITQLQTEKIIEWKKKAVSAEDIASLSLVAQNHAFNFQLWHAEDRARRDDQGFEFVYRAKREIDHCNQQRNNRMEAIDQAIWETLQPSTATDCPIHSETPGMMIDRLSILALKAYHMQLQTNRGDVDEAHRQQCRQKLAVILAQQQQLMQCYDSLMQEIKAGTRSFRVYHQFKMYNDASLNPELYGSRC
ncbi:MAG: DUF4254 domain-containing protein [Legionellaceae bacterium]|nr:DUF4254 domain-containing protein [Legionellaceae bacterium]